MKLLRPHLYAISSCLKQIFEEGYYADKVIERNFRANKNWGSKDRKVIAEGVYDIVRNWRYMWALLDKEINFEEKDLMSLIGVLMLTKNQDPPMMQEFQSLHTKIDQIRKRIKINDFSRTVRESIPDWIDKTCLNEIGSEWYDMLRALNQPTQLYLRVNTLKTSRNAALERFASEGLEALAVEGSDDAIVIPSKKNIFSLKSFHDGWYEIQDVASQTVAPLLNVKPGMRVIDACAGAGGKSLHIAALMQNKGTLIALDIHDKKLLQLKIRARRAGVHVIETRAIEGTKTVKRLESSADALLLDVPCSGLGVLRRNPDTKWKLKQEDLEEVRKIQQDILQNYSRMVKPNGRMVYSTCSILPSENEKQVEKFLAANPQWKLLGQHWHWPHREGYDGFFAAVLEKQKA